MDWWIGFRFFVCGFAFAGIIAHSIYGSKTSAWVNLVIFGLIGSILCNEMGVFANILSFLNGL